MAEKIANLGTILAQYFEQATRFMLAKALCHKKITSLKEIQVINEEQQRIIVLD